MIISIFIILIFFLILCGLFWIAIMEDRTPIECPCCRCNLREYKPLVSKFIEGNLVMICPECGQELNYNEEVA